MSMGWQRQRGVSLIEAMVAMAVMAFGMLGIVGLQSTLRQNADIAKQRAEAVRIAQEAIEIGRSYSVLATTPGQPAYADIVTRAGVAVDGYTTNTSFVLTQMVDTSADPRQKVLTATVSWVDRTGQAQGVQLATTIAGVPPELAGSLALPAVGSASSRPRSRNVVIPADALDLDDGTSRFQPPGTGDSVRWIFNNTSGYITSICTSSDPGSCVDVNARLLSGFVRFATGLAQPTPADAELPPSTALPVLVSVSRTSPAPAATVACFTDPTLTYVAYFCAITVTADSTPSWSGRSLLSGLPLATSIADVTASSYRVCRYTPYREQRLVPPMKNTEHPLDYATVSGGLTNQNFLVIHAGDGTTPFDCPADDTGTPNINSTTWHHQPDA